VNPYTKIRFPRKKLRKALALLEKKCIVFLALLEKKCIVFLALLEKKCIVFLALLEKVCTGYYKIKQNAPKNVFIKIFFYALPIFYPHFFGFFCPCESTKKTFQILRQPTYQAF
jgi:hypothetical protein